LTAFAISVPKPFKQSLTAIQIIQFFIGTSSAAIHAFISYTIPVEVIDVNPPSSSSTVDVSASFAGWPNLMQMYPFRATDGKGLAENLKGHPGEQTTLLYSAQPIQQYRMETVTCIDTSGQMFAIWLNVLYLTPLTILFIRFFIRSYITRTPRKAVHHATKH
jgi:hypothetical protein